MAAVASMPLASYAQSTAGARAPAPVGGQADLADAEGTGLVGGELSTFQTILLSVTALAAISVGVMLATELDDDDRPVSP
ncbi:hypothetical protein [Polymorphobacter multimanifer]|nr:hypothetical protein [Polymorphobacter multimanifer]